MGWQAEQTTAFSARIEFGTLDRSGSYRRVLEIMEAGASLVADPFHVTKLANTKLDECPCRVQNATLGHRGRESDPLSLPAPFDQGQRAGSTTKATITSSPASFVPAISIATRPPSGRPRKPCELCAHADPTSPSGGSPSRATA
jgi:hypothetical protein